MKNTPSFLDDDLFDLGEGGSLPNHDIPETAPSFPCPACKSKLTEGKFTIDFIYAPKETSVQTVKGYICECGKSRYTPGKIAKAAHERAFNEK